MKLIYSAGDWEAISTGDWEAMPHLEDVTALPPPVDWLITSQVVAAGGILRAGGDGAAGWLRWAGNAAPRRQTHGVEPPPRRGLRRATCGRRRGTTGMGQCCTCGQTRPFLQPQSNSCQTQTLLQTLILIHRAFCQESESAIYPAQKKGRPTII